MPNTQARHLFLPWIRQGLPASANVPDPLGPDIPARLTMRVQLLVNNLEAAEMPVHFYGPGDVLGIDPREIVRTEPRPRLSNFEPNLFPFLEFDRPDFPWLFTPARANSDGRLRPWLCLIVIPKQNGIRLSINPRQPLPVLECPLDELPNLSDSWAWAHAQVTSIGNDTSNPDLEELLRRYPERTVSRLLCPRRLESGVTYLACLVPAFAVGRKAGLGELVTAADEAELQPAWPAPTSEPAQQVQLPVYYHWEFLTGPAGDFEALVRRLQVRVLPDKVGVQRVAVHSPGWGIPPRPMDAPGSVLELAGVLKTPTTTLTPWPQTAAADFRGHVRAILNGSVNSENDPVVKPPVYGQEYAQTTGVPEEDVPPHWLRELNLDPRYRLAAGLGAMVVRYEQERLMASAWSQLAAAERNVQVQRRVEFGEMVNNALATKHLPALVTPEATSPAPSALRLQSREMSSFAAARRQASPNLISHANGSFARRLEVRRLISTHANGQPTEVASQTMRLQSASEGETTASPIGPFRFAPKFPQPMAELMRDYFPNMLLPNVSEVPPNTIALLETNPAFVEAYMVGLNHEMGRELLWREYPVNRRSTYFQNFWSDSARIQRSEDLPSIADWLPESQLGEHLQGSIGGTDPDLEGQIQAVQAQIQALVDQITALETEAATLSEERDAAYMAGEPTRTLLKNLRLQNALFQTRQFELIMTQQAILDWEAQALAADQAAADARASVNPQRAQLAELQVIAEQIPGLEANLHAILVEIAGFMQQIQAIQELGDQLPVDIEATQAAGAAAHQRLNDVQAQIATIPDLQAQAADADQESAGYQTQAQAAQASAAAIRATVEPARRRLAELFALAEDLILYKDKSVDLESQIGTLEFAIAEHKANQPPAPPDEEPKESPVFGGPIMGDPYEDYYRWLAQLKQMEEQLLSLQNELANVLQAMADIEAQLLEIPALKAEVNAAEQEAAPFDATASTALQAAATATGRANSLRNQIAALQQLATQIPVIEAEIQAANDLVITLREQLGSLPGQIAALEGASTEAQGRVSTAQAALDAVLALLVDMPTVQAEIATAETLAAVYETEAAAARQEKAQAQAQVVALEIEIAALGALVAQIPSVEADLQAIDDGLAARAIQIETLRGQLAEQVVTRDAAQAEVWQLFTERTLRYSQLVLLIRGDLLRRFSRASIYAVEAVWADESHTQRRLGPHELYPIFRETWGNDLTFLGFSLTGQEARGNADHPGWYFVIQEQPTEPRFGLDAPTGTGRPVENIPTWDSLSWDDLVTNPVDLPTLVYIPLDGRLSNQERPAHSGSQTPVARWGQTSAHMALITQQKPVRMAVHAGVWLPPANNNEQ